MTYNVCLKNSKKIVHVFEFTAWSHSVKCKPGLNSNTGTTPTFK